MNQNQLEITLKSQNFPNQILFIEKSDKQKTADSIQSGMK